MMTKADTETALSVLIVEDDTDIRELFALLLQGMGYVVSTAATAEEGLLRLHEHHVDIVLLDLMLPGMDGFAFCRIVRADRALHDLYIIITSASDALEDKIRAYEFGVADYLTKPFSLAKLQTRIQVGASHVRFQKGRRQQATDAQHMLLSSWKVAA